MTDLVQFVQLQYRVAAFLARQTADQLAALIEGRVSLALVPTAAEAAPKPVETRPTVPVEPPPKKTTRSRASKAPAAPEVDAEAIAVRLRGCQTVDEAAELLAELKLSATAQQAVARALGVVPKGAKALVAKQIVRQAVGARIKNAALRQG